MNTLRWTVPLAAALAVLAGAAQAQAQSVTVQGQVQYQPQQQQQGYGQPPPGYGQPYQQQPAYQQPVYQQPQPQVRYVEQEQSIKGLWIPGIIIFGVSYSLSGTFGLLGESGTYRDWMWVPIIGPWVAAGFNANEDELTGAIIGGLAQAAGLTMFVLGLSLRRTVRVAVYSLDESNERSPTLALDLLPSPGGGRIGMTLSHF